jgi:hypothetical protein
MLILVATMAATPDFGTVDQSLQELTDAGSGARDLLPVATRASTEMRHYKIPKQPDTQTEPPRSSL